MIKVGQVYYNADAGRYIVTRLWFDAVVDRCRIDCVYEDGTTNDYSTWYAEQYHELIAEYPTWQEAVNSKEFKND